MDQHEVLTSLEEDSPMFSHERRPQLPSGIKREDLSLSSINYACHIGSSKVNSLRMIGCMLMFYLG